MAHHLRQPVIHALVSTDPTSNEISIFTAEPGGPIISANTEADAKQKFLTALQLATNVKKLLVFEANLMDNLKNAELSSGFKNPKPLVKYIHFID